MSLPSNLSTRSFYIENLGCAKNQVDAEEMIRALEERGLIFSEEHQNADIIIVNTCGFIGPAKEESVDTVLGFRALYPGKKIVLAGCLAERYGKDMDLPEADGIFGNKNPSLITDIVESVFKNEHPVVIPDTGFQLHGRTKLLGFKGSAYVKIAEGCNNNCSFCAIPLIRGGVRSRSIDDIIEECKKLLNDGNFELNLIAQDLASFGIDKRPEGELIALLRRISQLKGDFWVRLLYIHPDRFPHELLQVINEDPRILPYFDLPFQHASPPILSSMGRKPDMEQNLALIDKIRDNFPNSIVRSTFLLGYPGETEDDLQILLEFQARAKLDWLGAFVYSKEEGTRAYELASDRQLKQTAKQALKYKQIIEENQISITEEQLNRFVNKDMRLLIEEPVEGEDLYICRGYPHAPEVDGAVVLHAHGLKAGDVVGSKIIQKNGFDLEAILIK